jgi:hypothetical protein
MVMSTNDPLVPPNRQVRHVTRDEPPSETDTILATRDHALIREWASHVEAEPATGERTESGPATGMRVNDGGTGLRFNFPGVGRFRAISWNEWLEHFNRHDLTFVYENPQATQPPSARYRLVRTQDLGR